MTVQARLREVFSSSLVLFLWNEIILFGCYAIVSITHGAGIPKFPPLKTFSAIFALLFFQTVALANSAGDKVKHCLHMLKTNS